MKSMKITFFHVYYFDQSHLTFTTVMTDLAKDEDYLEPTQHLLDSIRKHQALEGGNYRKLNLFENDNFLMYYSFWSVAIYV